MEKQVYPLRLCRNYFKWLNRLLLPFYSIIKNDLYVIMMNKLIANVASKPVRPWINKMCLAISLPNARRTSSIFQVCFSQPLFFVTSECMNSFILFCKWYISNTRISVSLAATTTSLSCFFVYWIAVDTIRVFRRVFLYCFEHHFHHLQDVLKVIQ